MKRTGDPRKDLWSSAVLLLIGGGYLLYDLRYALDTLANPGPGVFPLAVGLLLMSLGAAQLFQSGRLLLTRRAAKPDSPLDSPAEPPKEAWAERVPWLMVGILILYLMVVGWIGFLASTFALVILCSKLMGTRGWIRPIALAVGILVGCHFLFSVWLHVPLPTGYLM